MAVGDAVEAEEIRLRGGQGAERKERGVCLSWRDFFWEVISFKGTGESEKGLEFSSSLIRVA